jgi:DNA-binding MarR family transcriptional regulator
LRFFYVLSQVLGLPQLDELLFAAKELSSQIAALSLFLSQGASSCNAEPFDDTAGNNSRVEDSNRESVHDPGKQQDRLKRAVAPILPDPRLIRRIIRQRQQRERFFNNELFADPVWDMLLDLAAAASEYRRVSVTSLCIASRVPPSTALRWIGLMTDQGLLLRIEDPLDRRRVFVSLSNEAKIAMARYFESLGSDAKILI